MAVTAFDVERVRERFSALRQPFAFLDAPGGTQVPDEVGTAMADAVRDASGNPEFKAPLASPEPPPAPGGAKPKPRPKPKPSAGVGD